MRCVFPLALAAFAALTAVCMSAEEPIPLEQVEPLHKLIKPHEGETDWAGIPWLTSLWEARRQAAAEGKPILLWEMDGHPLGCT